MNRELSLHNALICPKIHRYLMNTYQKVTRVFIGKGFELESQEGTTEGYNIAMAYYAVGMKPLMDRLEGENIVQEWFVNDAACLVELLPAKKWWDQIKELWYGYFPKASKCWLICKSEEIATEAKRTFENAGIDITQHFWYG